MLNKSDNKNIVEINDICKNQREFFSNKKTLSHDHRIYLLNKIKRIIKESEKDLEKALEKDLGKCRFEAQATEITFVLGEIDFILKSLKKWMRAKRVSTPKVHFPAKSWIRPQPYGNVLIIGPWNYPFHLLFSPLIGAISAGNTVVLKPSELAPATSSLILEMINENFDTGEIRVIEGGVEETTELLEQKFDYIFYTGGPFVGKIIMEKAAKHLTPITLELGGKSPCVVLADVDMEVTAKRIIWGKFINAGQTCVAPDYLLIEKNIKDEFIKICKKVLKDFYGNDIKNNSEYGRVINERHFKRLESLLFDAKILIGDKPCLEDLYFPPTFVKANLNSKIMEEEIFGPILPMIEISGVQEAIEIIEKRDNPLALYLFTNNRQIQNLFVRETNSGGLLINDTMIHLSNLRLPFGGVGNSGIGGYHGEFSFKTFSHYKSIMKRYFKFDVPIKYPPYLNKLKLVKWLLKYLGN